MLSHPTLDQLKNLKLHGMARAFAEFGDNLQAGELDHAQWLALLLDREQAERDDRRHLQAQGYKACARRAKRMSHTVPPRNSTNCDAASA